MWVHFPDRGKLYSVLCLLGFCVTAGASGGFVADVIASRHASVNGSSVPGEWTIARGDVLSTAADGSALLNVSSKMRVRLVENTSVVFDRDSTRLTLRMLSGTMGVQTAGKDGVVVSTAQFTVQAATPGRVEYVIAMLQDRTLVSARRGDVSVRELKSGKQHTVSQGSYGMISQAPGAVPATAGAAGASASSAVLANGPLLFAISVGTGTAVGFGVGDGILGISPPSPSGP
jgi:FecR protein